MLLGWVLTQCHKWRRAGKNVNYSRKIHDSEAIPCPFTCALVVRNVRMIPVSPTIISRLRRRPDLKKIKILDKRWWNVQRHRISHYATWNQCKVLCISNMLFVKTMWNRCFRWCLRIFHHCLSRIFDFFKSGLLLSRDMMVGDTGIMRTLRTTNAHVKGQGLTKNPE